MKTTPMFVLFLTVFIDLIGFGIIIPILPFAAPKLGASHLDIALIIVVYSICGALVSPLWGRLSDRWGRKKTLLVCLAGSAVCSLMLAFVTTLAALYLVRIVAGCFSGNFGVATAMAADLSTPQNRARAMGTVGAAFGLGMVVGPSLGGLLAGPEASLLLPGLVAAGLTVAAIVFGVLLLPETVATAPAASKGPRESMRQLLTRTGNRGLVAQFVVLTGAISTVSYLFPLATGHYLGWGPKQVGIVFGIQGLCMAALQAGLVGRLAQRFGELALLKVALTLMIGGFCIAAIAHTQPLLLAGFFISITGAACCPPVLNSLLSQRTPPQLRGQMMGTSGAASSWGRVFGPLLAGLALSQFGYAAAWALGAIAGIATLLWAVQTTVADPVLPAAKPSNI